jgi:hypothetical protein
MSQVYTRVQHEELWDATWLLTSLPFRDCLGLGNPSMMLPCFHAAHMCLQLMLITVHCILHFVHIEQPLEDAYVP